MGKQHYIGHAASFLQVFSEAETPAYELYHVEIEGGRYWTYFTDASGQKLLEAGPKDLSSGKTGIDKAIEDGFLVPVGEPLPPVRYNPLWLALKQSELMDAAPRYFVKH